MAEFRIQVHYQQGTGQKWSNVWRVDAADLFTAASAAAGTMVPGLLPVLNPACQIVRVLTSDPASPGTFIEAAVGAVGTSSATGNLMPLFACARVLFPLLSGGRPDYKFLKGWLTEGLQDNGVIDSSSLTVLEGFFGSLISDMSVAGATLIDNSGNNYSVVTAQSNVQERQMHRRRRHLP